MNVLETIFEFISTDYFSNVISFLGLVVTLMTIYIGGNKVSEFYEEYKKKQYNALFGYYTNLKYYILRLKKVTTTSSNVPLGCVYLLSSNESVKNLGNGCESVAQKLSLLSQEILSYLCNHPEQIPIGKSKEDVTLWNNLIEQLIQYLSNFVFINTDINLPELNTKESADEYHKNFISILDQITNMIDLTYGDFCGDVLDIEISNTSGEELDEELQSN